MGLKIIIPKHIWNAYRPAHLQCDATERRSLCIASRDCKIKLFRFHYGGVTRKQRGKFKNAISYEGPCLKPTCASCLEWHPDRVWEGAGMRGSEDGERADELAARGVPVSMTHSDERCPTSRKPAGRVQSIPQKQCNVRLKLSSQRGKRKFRTLVRQYEGRERRGRQC